MSNIKTSKSLTGLVVDISHLSRAHNCSLGYGSGKEFVTLVTLTSRRVSHQGAPYFHMSLLGQDSERICPVEIDYLRNVAPYVANNSNCDFCSELVDSLTPNVEAAGLKVILDNTIRTSCQIPIVRVSGSFSSLADWKYVLKAIDLTESTIDLRLRAAKKHH